MPITCDLNPSERMSVHGSDYARQVTITYDDYESESSGSVIVKTATARAWAAEILRTCDEVDGANPVLVVDDAFTSEESGTAAPRMELLTAAREFLGAAASPLDVVFVAEFLADQD